MSLSSEDIQRIARLAKLSFAPQETEAMRESINRFFHLVEKMQTVDTEGVEPLFHPVSTIQDVRLRLQEDVADTSDLRSGNMQNAPAAEDGFFLVPKVIE
ncbi:Asp-tRNA(Asn)/Glu-tRNA(Gln) amidotransferase subunit GatC [Allofranklinella schreckenbergeri]|uniref:Aspartyl/glutamyl-tRNA(Asn/Gln) amidotransferase subunit C n=1 Tax=Allofranklinella schreckenbergeri TaxID=1076744 RepID=A0A3M6QWA3_9BURK|nr:Asp-tRNA(Asn)/Glu-tRNA(Gln) amidotransferase subunit GatC [Allofranklinella schreckenbergeri]RMX07290.1 Asp-tRNA(Asn)/Glu-tRNA(Gln) amidotransferase subunit GatC [Allofranklinella schreckenbergeri]